MTLFLTLLLVILAAPSPAPAQINKPDSPVYGYTNKDGVEVFTNDPDSIPTEYRSSSKKIPLPPVMLMPSVSPSTRELSPLQRAKRWSAGLSPATRLMILGVFPLAALSIGGLLFFGKHTGSPSMRLFFKLGIVLLVMASLYLFYFLYMKNQAEKLFGPIPAGTNIQDIPRMMIEPIQKQEEDRLQKIEEIANE